MDRISAAGNLTIEMKPESWRLIANGGGQEQVLAEAAPGQPLHYVSMFAQKRRLPDTGVLTSDQIQRVVLGWSQQDEAWHLGLLLDAELATARGSRWCEMARWPDTGYPDSTMFSDIALQAGRSLAGALNRPFNFITPAETAPSPAPPLPPLPLRLGEWTLTKTDSLEFHRDGRWARSRVLRFLWYGLLVAVYVALSLLTLQGQIALPRPEFLPYLGLAVAVLLVGGMGYTLYQLLFVPNRIVINPAARTIAGCKGRRERWLLTPDAYQSIYVSQIVGKKGKKAVSQHGELNALLISGRFRFLLEVGEGGELPRQDNSDLLVELQPQDVHTDLQAAGLYVAQALNVPCWYDRRGR